MVSSGLQLVLNILDIIVGIFYLVIGFYGITSFVFASMVFGICLVIIGGMIVVLDLCHVKQLENYVGFYFTFGGRGLLFLFFGVQTLGGNTDSIYYICAIISLVMGCLYVGTQLFMCCNNNRSCIPFPYPMCSDSAGSSGTTTTTTRTTTKKNGTTV